MAMIAHKQSVPMSAGLGAPSSAREYQHSSASTHNRTPLPGSTQNGTFASPTESEFSEAYDGTDAVRYDEPVSLCESPLSLRQKEKIMRMSMESPHQFVDALSSQYPALLGYLDKYYAEKYSDSSSQPVEMVAFTIESNIDCRNWDERRVGEWLRSISCGQYADAFKGEDSDDSSR